jgi:hypothetical protein
MLWVGRGEQALPCSGWKGFEKGLRMGRDASFDNMFRDLFNIG